MNEVLGVSITSVSRRRRACQSETRRGTFRGGKGEKRRKGDGTPTHPLEILVQSDGVRVEFGNRRLRHLRLHLAPFPARSAPCILRTALLKSAMICCAGNPRPFATSSISLNCRPSESTMAVCAYTSPRGRSPRSRARERRDQIRHEVMIHERLRVLLQPSDVVRGQRFSVRSNHRLRSAPPGARLVVEIHPRGEHGERQPRGHVPERAAEQTGEPSPEIVRERIEPLG